MVKTKPNLLKQTSLIICAIAALLFPTTLVAHAQEPLVYFDQITLDDGLSDNTVYSIVQGGTGYLWFGTQNGLNRYNGYEFDIFRHDPFNANTVSNDNAGNLYADRAGNIWIGTWGGGLDKYDPLTGQFTHYRHNPNSPNSISFDRVQTIFEDKAGNIWIGTAGGGLNKLEPETGTFTLYQSDPDTAGSISNDRIWRVVEDNRGQLWIATSDGLNRFDPQKEIFTHYFADPGDPGSLSHSLIRTLHLDRAGTLWVGTEEGLNRYNPSTDDFEVFLHNRNDPTSLSENIINAIYEDTRGRLWIGTSGGGLNLLDRSRNSFTQYLNNPLDPKSLSYDDIRAIHEDGAGVIWLGTRGGGVNKLVPTSGQFIHFANDPATENSLSNNDVRAVIEDDAGKLWIGTRGGGLNQYDPQTGSFTHYRHNPEDPNSIANDEIYAIFQDNQGVFWFGTSGAGLDRFDPKNGQFDHFEPNPADPNSISSPDINNIFEDNAGSLWIGTKGGGLSRFDRATETFTNYMSDSEAAGAISNNDIYAIHQGSDNGLWVGTYGGGLNRFEPGSETFAKFVYNPEDINSLSDNNIYDIYEDDSGLLWIATANGGLNKIDPQTGSTTRFTQRDGLGSDVVYAIVPDDTGNLWLSTNQGITKFSPNSTVFVNFDATDGLSRVNYREGSAFKGRDGAIYFGGINGLTKFYPEQLSTNSYVPPVVLTNLTLLNQPIQPDIPIDQLTAVGLTYEDDMLGLEFAALDFTDPEKNQFAYRLEGFDNGWNYTGSRPFATYTNLDPGNYTLRIRGSNNAGVWNDAGVSLAITVTPPFWETWWFRTLSVLAVLGIGFVVYKIRVRSIENQREQLQVEVAQRTAELVETNQQLQTVTGRLQNEFRLAQKIQQGLLPETTPDANTWHMLDVVCYSEPANEVGGDFFDYYHLQPEPNTGCHDRFAVIVGDVSGKGMPAALMMGVSTGSLQSIMAQAPAQEVVIDRLNNTLRPYTQTTGQNCALCYVEFCNHQLSAINAGCIPPIIRRGDGQTFWLEATGLPLGIVIDKPRTYHRISDTLKPGDMIILLSDGVIEASDGAGAMYGFDRFEMAVRKGPETSATNMLEHLKREITGFVGEAELHDDFTVVVIRYKE
jgi:ligand-binding sensor domain-containing protein/serine phosphatase RsbU (regulator of sigma subunit)